MFVVSAGPEYVVKVSCWAAQFTVIAAVPTFVPVLDKLGKNTACTALVVPAATGTPNTPTPEPLPDVPAVVIENGCATIGTAGVIETGSVCVPAPDQAETLNEVTPVP